MKNKILKTTGILILGGYLLFAGSALAQSSVVLTPSKTDLGIGDTFSVVISVNPEGDADYAEKIELDFPADTIELQSFALAPTWVSLSQDGYEKVDNTNGVIVKSAGYPSGITNQTVFGTAVFKTKKAGSAIISVGSSSVSFDESTQTPVSGNNISVNISVPVVETQTVVNTNTTVNTPKTQNNTSSVSQNLEKENATTTSEDISTSTSNQLAQVGGTDFNYNWFWLLIALVLAGSAYYHFKIRSKTPKRP